MEQRVAWHATDNVRNAEPAQGDTREQHREPRQLGRQQETQNAQEARRHRLQQPNRDDQSPDHGHATEPQRDQRSGHMHAGKSRNDKKTGPDRTSPLVLQQAAAGRADHAEAHEVDFLVKARSSRRRNHDGVEQRDRQDRDVLQADGSEYRQRRSLIQPIDQVVRSANDQPPVCRPSTRRRLTTTLSAASQPDDRGPYRTSCTTPGNRQRAGGGRAGCGLARSVQSGDRPAARAAYRSADRAG